MPIYIVILFFTIIIDYIAGIMIEDAVGSRRRMFLMLSIVANVGVLAVFKYYNFFTGNVNELLTMMHLTVHPLPLLHILLPIGLSFHTFQAMSYTIEVYRGNHKAERHFGIYSLYVMFYPQLVAGPIERPQNMLHQFREPHTFDSRNLIDGLRLMLWGFFKKLVIADRAALYLSIVYHDPGHFHFLNLIIAISFFTIQVYCDFSGYSDIAIGAARVMGFDLMTNFNRPLISKSYSDFWRKWHISLTTWFTDYVFSPFVTERRDWGKLALVLGIMMTFLLSGLWHGAAWTFVIWGGLNGLGLVYELLTAKQRKKITKAMPSWFYIPFTTLLVFGYTSFCSIFFRANNVQDAFIVVKHLFTFYHAEPFKMVLTSFENRKIQFGGMAMTLMLVLSVVMLYVESKISVKTDSLNSRPVVDVLFCTLVLTLLVLFGVFNNNSFIYFQF